MKAELLITDRTPLTFNFVIKELSSLSIDFHLQISRTYEYYVRMTLISSFFSILIQYFFILAIYKRDQML